MSPKDNNKQVSAAVRILHQKRDASARATHLMVKNDPLITYEKAFEGQAAVKKFFIATFLERKKMSTKTSFKRIALVAASALALAGISAIAAPQANAADNTNFVVSKLTKVNGVALTSSNYTSSAVFDTRGISSFNVSAGDTVTLVYVGTGGTTTAATDSITVTMRGLGDIQVDTATVAATGAPFQAQNGVTTGPGQNGAFVATSVAGSYVLDITMKRGAAGAAVTTVTTSVTMVVAALSSYSNPLSTAYINSGITAADADSDAIAVSAVKTAWTAAANILISLKNASGVAQTGNLITAEVTGPGVLMFANSGTPATCTATVYSATVGRSIAPTTTTSDANIAVCSDGTSGVGTVTIMVTNSAGVKTTLATKTVTFYGSVAALSIEKSNFKIGKAGANTTGATVATSDTITYTPAFVVAAKDSSGTLANTVAAPTIVPADATIVSGGTCVLDTNDATYGSGPVGYYNCNFTTPTSAKSGQSTVLTVRIADPADATKYLTTTYTVTIGGSVATTVLSTDKASYSAGEVMTVTLTAKDSSGNPVYDGAASPAVSGNKAFGGALPAASYFVGGVVTTSANTVYAPAVGGDFIITATGTDAAATKLSATGTVEGDASASLALDAANAATDAANNAYDEAQNATQAASDALAAVTALAAQVKSLIASVKKLTTAVAKLKK